VTMWPCCSCSTGSTQWKKEAEAEEQTEVCVCNGVRLCVCVRERERERRERERERKRERERDDWLVIRVVTSCVYSNSSHTLRVCCDPAEDRAVTRKPSITAPSPLGEHDTVEVVLNIVS
jgi:hypothetical protein